jgi:hypothetical protein
MRCVKVEGDPEAEAAQIKVMIYDDLLRVITLTQFQLNEMKH